MMDPAILALFFAVAVMIAVAATLFYTALSSSENWPMAGWACALAFEAVRRALLLIAPDLMEEIPIPGDTVQLLGACGFFVAAASGRRRRATSWVALGLTVSTIAVIAAAYRPEFAMLFATMALILAAIALWRWRRAPTMIAAACLVGWACLRLAALSEASDILEPTAMDLATGLLAMISGLALMTDLIVPSRHPRVRSTGIRAIPRDLQDLGLANTAKPDDTQELDDIQDRVDDELQWKTEEIDRLLSSTLSNMAEGLVAIGADTKILLINDSLRRFLDLSNNTDLVGQDLEVILFEVAERGDLGPGDPKATADVFVAQLWQMAKSQEPAFE
jgi:PAS domain-containing protein